MAITTKIINRNNYLYLNIHCAGTNREYPLATKDDLKVLYPDLDVLLKEDARPSKLLYTKISWLLLRHYCPKKCPQYFKKDDVKKFFYKGEFDYLKRRLEHDRQNKAKNE